MENVTVTPSHFFLERQLLVVCTYANICTCTVTSDSPISCIQTHLSFSLHFQVDSMSGSQSAAFAELESQVAALRSEVAKKEKTKRELMEMKDRNAALEEQLSEYMGAVRDQSKVGRSFTINNDQSKG